MWGNFIKRFLLSLGVAISKAVLPDEVGVLLQKLRPLEMTRNLVRVGGKGDGGYLIPEDLEEIGAVFSPGVAETCDFEMFFAERNVPCFLIDGSVSSPPISHPFIDFEKLWLGESTKSGFSVDLETWIARTKLKNKDFILQMDIEGAEYASVLSTSADVLSNFRILVFELHDLHSITSRSGFRLVSAFLNHLEKTHVLVHSHVNNGGSALFYGGNKVPDLVELTFYRKDRVVLTGALAKTPHPLDAANTSDKVWHLNETKIR